MPPTIPQAKTGHLYVHLGHFPVAVVSSMTHPLLVRIQQYGRQT